MKYYFHRFLIVAILCLLFLSSYCQIYIRGQITDSVSKPVAFGNIILKKDKRTISYAVSDVQGNFYIRYSDTIINSKLFLQISALGYRASIIYITDSQQFISSILNHTSEKLPDVKVNSRPFVRSNGDTLTYNANQFVEKQDRSLGDILKKIPGIDVSEDGKISFNGKAISNFYIDGDNLLDDKYNIATNSIQSTMVDKIQVLERHQPIKVLKNITRSNQVAMNIILKDSARLKVSTHEEIGVGIPDVYDGTINMLSFKRKYKAINSFKMNNAGSDLSDDLASHNLADYLKRIENDAPDPLLSLNSIGTPQILKRRYLFNESQMVNVNNLVNYKNNSQFKMNFSYLHDIQQRNFNSDISYFLTNDSVIFSEVQRSRLETNQVKGLITFNRNTNHVYINDNFQVIIQNDNGKSDFSNSVITGDQWLTQNYQNVSNDFNILKVLNSHTVFEIYSYINYFKRPEKLFIYPGINPDVFNNGALYRNITQTVGTEDYIINNYVNLRSMHNGFLVNFKAGFLDQNMQLPSSISVTQNDLTTKYATDSFRNELKARSFKSYGQIDIEIPARKLLTTFSFPFNYQTINYSNFLHPAGSQITRLYTNPSVQFRIQTPVIVYMLRYNYNSNNDGIKQLYRGFILKNFQQLDQNLAGIQDHFTHTIFGSLSYREDIKLLFANFSFIYSSATNTTIANSIYFPNLVKTSFIPFENHTGNILFSTGVSKYIFSAKSTLAVNGSYQIGRWNQLQQNILLNFNNVKTSLSLSLSSKLFTWISSNYTLRFVSNRIVNIDNSAKSMGTGGDYLKNQLQMTISASDNIYFKLAGEYNSLLQTTSNKINYFFGDFSLNFKLVNIKADLVLSVDNFTNETNYTSFSITGNSLSRSQYMIRPRTVLCKLIFNL